MATTLAILTDRVEQTLADTGNLIWAAGAVTEGIRSAIGEYNTAAKIDDPTATAVTLDGLDTAIATTLPAIHDTVILWGAAAYCAQARAVDRADSYQLGSKIEVLKAWADQRLREFKAMLGAIFPAYLAVAFSSGAGGSADPAKTAAEIALLAAQTTLTSNQATAAAGQESRAAAAAAKALADETAEAARKAGLRTTDDAAWGSWDDDAAHQWEGEKPE